MIDTLSIIGYIIILVDGRIKYKGSQKIQRETAGGKCTELEKNSEKGGEWKEDTQSFLK